MCTFIISITFATLAPVSDIEEQLITDAEGQDFMKACARFVISKRAIVSKVKELEQQLAG